LLIKEGFYNINKIIFTLKDKWNFEWIINAKIDFLKEKDKFNINSINIKIYNSEDKLYWLEKAEYIIKNLLNLNSGNFFQAKTLILNLIKDNIYIDVYLIKVWIDFLIKNNNKEVICELIKCLVIFKDVNYKSLVLEYINLNTDLLPELREILIENNIYYNEFKIVDLLNQINVEEDILKLRKYKIENILFSIFKSWDNIKIGDAKKFVEEIFNWNSQNSIKMESIFNFINLLIEFAPDQIEYVFYLLNNEKISKELSQCNSSISHELSIPNKIIKWLLKYPPDERMKEFIKYLFIEKIKQNNVIAIRDLLNSLKESYGDFWELIDIGVKFLLEKDKAWLIHMPKIYLNKLVLNDELKKCYANKKKTLKQILNWWDKRIIDSVDAVNILLHWLISNNQYIIDICSLVKRWIIYSCNHLFMALAINYNLINYNDYQTGKYSHIIWYLYEINKKMERWREKIILEKKSFEDLFVGGYDYYSN